MRNYKVDSGSRCEGVKGKVEAEYEERGKGDVGKYKATRGRAQVSGKPRCGWVFK